jgi:hypothetical protein
MSNQEITKMKFPQICKSANCGNIVCDGCPYRPSLAAWYASKGKDFEASQANARAIMLKVLA